MRGTKLARFMAFLLLGLAFSCSSRPVGPAPAGSVDDELIRAEVLERINLEPSLRNAPISVQTSQGVVTLRGMVEDVIDRNLAESIAGKVEGVQAVRNLLEVKRQGRFPFFRRW